MADKYHFVVDQQHWLAVVSTDGHVVWRGKPEAVDVQQAVAIAGTDDCLVLLDWRHASSGNLLRMTPYGDVVWQVRPPGGTPYGVDRSRDFYVAIRSVGVGEARANSFAGFLDTIEVGTGSVLATEFVK